MSFADAYHISYLVYTTFTDSEIAKNHFCKRTKNAHITVGAMAQRFNNHVNIICNSQNLSVIVDDLNDNGNFKRLAILMRIKKLRTSPALRIMIDESTDLSLEKHMIVNVNYLKKGKLRTRYLTLIKLVSADSNAV